MKKISVLIADDQEITREGLVQMLRHQDTIRVEGLANHGAQLMELMWEKQPDVVLLDIRMPVLDGQTAARLLREQYPQTGIVVLTNYDDDELVKSLMATGVQGYLLKNTGRVELVNAIETVHAGRQYYCAAIEEKMESFAAPPPPRESDLPDLSRREQEVMELICQGCQNKQIGRQLGISTRTVEKVRERLYEKLDVNNSYGLIMFALQHGLFQEKPLHR